MLPAELWELSCVNAAVKTEGKKGCCLCCEDQLEPKKKEK